MAPPKLGGELPFKIGVAGYSGELQVEILPPISRSNPLDDLPELILPPVQPPQTSVGILAEIEEKYLVPRLDSDIDDVKRTGKYWEVDWFGDGFYLYEPSLAPLTISPVWKPPFRRKESEYRTSEEQGRVWVPEFEQIKPEYGSDAASSMLRKPGNPADFVRGSSSNQPFRPGGVDLGEKIIPEGAQNGEWLAEVLEGKPLQTVAPGFKRGLSNLGVPEPFTWSKKSDVSSAEAFKEPEKKDSVLHYEDLFRKAWEHQMLEESEDDDEDPIDEVVLKDEVEPESEVDKILATETVEAAPVPKAEAKQEWVVMDGDSGVAERFLELIPDMAIQFPFELDKFQKEAIYHLEKNESVFVAAHTSAGKTVVAEYAFALSAKHCTRAVYTSPIKTISNQKYRDFSEKFDVGLLTGDVSIRPEASCLIMTTEILRSMLYKGADLVRDIEWVVFDEVHYVNDAERGVVWEEVIIMLPQHVNLVLLSATVPNIREFADWVGRTKQKKIYVTGTTKRPVPLEHCLFYSGELHRICANETFLSLGVKAAKDAHLAKTTVKKGPVAPTQGGRGNVQGRGGPGGRGGRGNKVIPEEKNSRGGPWRSETSQWYGLINVLSKKNLLPVVVFCFSKSRCDQSADSLTGSDLTTSTEKGVIRVFCNKAFSRLKGTDRQLPQVLRIEELLKRGIGVHHAGLLPIVKEVVEMLFCRGVIKVLFSTETFAMGVNAPARTVAFHGFRKHDGKSFRQLYPGEYTQMAGRAGRRGLDTVGTVIVMCWDDIPDEGDLRRLLTGKATKLESQFRLTYTMILNLLRVEELKVEDMLKRSFAEFHAQRALPEQQQQLLRQEGELSKMAATIECILGDPTIEDYYKLASEADMLGESIQEKVMNSRAAQQALIPGRIVTVKTTIYPVPALGVVLRGPSGTTKMSIVLTLYRGAVPASAKLQPPTKKLDQDGGYFISKKNKNDDDEFAVFSGSKKSSGVIRLTMPHYGTVGGVSFLVAETSGQEFLSISKEKIRVDANRILEEESTMAISAVLQALTELERLYPADPPPLDPVKDLKLNDIDAVEKYKKKQAITELMAQNKCHRCPKLQEHYSIIKSRQLLRDRVDKLKFDVSDNALQQMPEFQRRMDVLQDVGCIDSELIVQLKGRVTCEFNTGDELIAAECLFDNQLADLDSAESIALLSSLVFQQRETSEPVLTEKLAAAKTRLYNTALQLGDLQVSHGLVSHAEDYARDALHFGLMEVVYEWAKGTPFSTICEMTDVSEGLVVRTIVRLDETCREIKNAARIMGDTTLFNKMDEASNLIKRDIVFAASLYVTGLV
ncbi:hypothetical protein SELMODRAFT_403447 [Selaginella moellendorffii]|uniref:Uncharacterized protein n=1 Tax=Selaginella moellendorffii TaxID=88036 RepID=D8QRF8_SELML|nr:DExH-box ATP-dependent RNA helicase DExH11 [Selaginella moellendorffii]EFJ37244.1 hypothetical protein SELMODRAFT_403447 [Selaginella moellendorffii]|eukprot:XP_002961984.1 DExH-box ATP-dependent RNA helicase DExH11 [Selaginella moellendorffii]